MAAGRCAALTHVLSSDGQHKRCALTDSGNSFCARYHLKPETRIFGTIWAHAEDCRVCFKSASVSASPDTPHVPPQQSDKPTRKSTAASVAVPAPRASAANRLISSEAIRTKATAPSASAPARAPARGSTKVDLPAAPNPGAAAPKLPPPNAILFTPVSAEARELEARYVGPSGLKLRVRLARGLQPANWCAQPPEFMSCIDPLRLTSTARLLALERRLEQEEDAREEKREIKRAQNSQQRAAMAGRAPAAHPVVKSEKSQPPPQPPGVSQSRSAVVASPYSDSSVDSEVHYVGTVTASSKAETSKHDVGESIAPSLVAPVPPVAKPPPSPGSAAVIMSGEVAAMRALHRSALAADLEFSPMGGDSWLTSTLIDAVAFECVGWRAVRLHAA
jgi:hypothetical protein